MRPLQCAVSALISLPPSASPECSPATRKMRRSSRPAAGPPLPMRPVVGARAPAARSVRLMACLRVGAAMRNRSVAVGERDAVRQIARRAPDDGDAGEMRRGRRGYDRGEVGGDRLGDDGDGGASRPPAPAPLAQAAGAGDERSDALAALDAQHMAAVDDDTATVAKRLQGVQQRGAVRRIGELPWFRRLGADRDEGRRESERRGGGDRSAAIERTLYEQAAGIGAAHQLGAIERDGALGEHGDAAQPGLQRAHRPCPGRSPACRRASPGAAWGA